MAKAMVEIQAVGQGYRAVIYVEYPLSSALSVSPERFLMEKKRVDLAKSCVLPTREHAEGIVPALFVQFGIRQ